MIYFVSDLHLDHYNIIRYCNRPFRTVDEMNRHILDSWNEVVSSDDTVYFLGDMAYGRHRRPPSYWLQKLNGNVVFVRGSHDPNDGIRYYNSLVLNMVGEKVLLIHNPWHIPEDWDGWVVHGHSHRTRPFVSYDTKRINVSVEQINYKPISLEIVKSIVFYREIL